MAMMGISEIAIVFAMLFGGGVGIPLSLPPAEPDKLLDAMSPAEATFYSNWAGIGEIDAASKNATEQLFAEPEIQEFIRKAEAAAVTALAKAGQQDRGAAMASQLAPTIVKTLLTRPMMVYVKDVEITSPQAPPKLHAGLAINLGSQFQAVTRLLKMIPAEQTEEVTIDGAKFRKLQPPAPDSPVIVFGTRGPYLLVGVGEGEAEALVERAANPAPAWLAELRSRFPVERVATVTRFDVKGAMQTAAPLMGPQVGPILQMTGLDGLTQYVAVTGLDESGFAQYAALDLEGEPRGILALAGRENLTEGDLAPIPLGSLFAVAGKFDAQKTLENALELAGTANPNAIAQFNDAIQQVEGVVGMRVREDILASLGDAWTLHTHDEDGGLISGWTLTVSVKDSAKMVQLSQRLMQLGNQMARGPRDPRIEWNQFQGVNMFTVSAASAEMPFAPTWCVTESHLVIGMFPQAIKSHLKRQQATGMSIATQPKVAAMIEKGSSGVAAVNNKRMIELVYPFAQIGLRMGLGELAREGVAIDYSMLPSLTSIAPHLGYGVTANRLTDRGFEMEQHQVLPGGSVGATAPISVGLLLPAVQAARQSARRMSSMNNLKQIALALHNFHDTHRGFPPRYSTDGNGKPLLSWRVYLLPYLEQGPLFEQFKLDEPWDSEHNKKLIAMMPPVYASPSTPLEPGKTTYLTIAAKDGILQGPNNGENGKTYPRTTGFRDVLDGTSNTVMFVEGNASSAVTWTKPDDYEYSDEDPAKGLRGVYPNVMLMGMGDGSVRAIAEAVMPQTIKALFTRNGGEVVQIP